jgi:tRNA pseudouridine55 synthase
MTRRDAAGPDGIALVDKPAGPTSHDVVARLRKAAGTRRVGHAGTLDPAATGLLVVGIGRGTRLLTYLTGCDKGYTATIRLGQSTLTDDAEGEVVATAAPDAVAGVTLAGARAATGPLTGAISQVPCAFSAIKVNGVRSYAKARAGEAVALPARPVTISRFEVLALRRAGAAVDVDVEVEVSSGTYVRALARDLGAALGVGGHLTALRRTRVGPWPVDQALPLAELEADFAALSLARAAAARFEVRRVTQEEASALAHGNAIAAHRTLRATRQTPLAAIAPDGALIALLADAPPRSRPLVVFA